METLKKQTNIRGDVKETDKCSWRRESNRHIFVETLEKQINIGRDVKETANIGGDGKETDKYWWRR